MTTKMQRSVVTRAGCGINTLGVNVDTSKGVAARYANRSVSGRFESGRQRPKIVNNMASALSSCHMMTFLALAAKAGWPVASYHDYAEAHLGKNPKGQMSVTRIDLHPVVRFDTGFAVADEKLAEMQDRAHRYCFIANTLADSVEINIR